MTSHILFPPQLATHVVWLQQPPLQKLEPTVPQAVEHLKLEQACPAGQSLATLQPQAPPSRQAPPFDEFLQSPLPTQPHAPPPLHAEPAAAFVQSTHAWPDGAQLLPPMPLH